MPEISAELRRSLIDALAQADDQSRKDRAERIIWLSELPRLPPAYAGRFEQLHLLEEVRNCFVHGHHIALLLAATAFVEQTLVEELEAMGHAGPRRNLGDTIASARNAQLLPPDLLDRADTLRRIRNPLGHYRPPGDPDGVISRFRSEGSHPTAVLEADAKLAVRVVFETFIATLRYG